MSNIDALLDKFRNLNTSKQQVIEDLINELSVASNDTPQSSTKAPSYYDVKSTNSTKLSIGDRVRILSNAKTGKIGDIVTITKLNQRYIALRLERNGSYTQRIASNVEFIESQTK